MSKKYKCYYCEKRLIRKDLITHIEKTHQELIPQGYTASRLVYNQVNRVDQGKCRVCGKPTTWNEKSGRYNVLCDNPKCKEYMREEYKKNMLKVRGTYNILNDPNQQKKMLANRRISGTYKFSDGGALTYTGSYEKKCLEFMDVVMQIPSKDILSPGPTLEYMYNGEKHFYITDFYYIPYNLIIEVKDGGDNLNTKDSASMKASREKTIEKEHIITDRGEYNYIRLTNNNFAQLIEVFMEIKQKLLEGDDSKTYKINESSMVLKSYFNEEAFITRKPLWYNDKDVPGVDHNLLILLGSNINNIHAWAYKAERDNSDSITACSMDNLIVNFMVPDDKMKEKFKEPEYVFLKGTGKKYRYSSKIELAEYINKSGKNGYAFMEQFSKNITIDFIKFIKSYARSHKNKRIIVVAGTSVLRYINPSEFDNCVVYIYPEAYGKYLAADIIMDELDIFHHNINPIKEIKRAIDHYISKRNYYKNLDSDLNKYYDYFQNKITNSNANKQYNESNILESKEDIAAILLGACVVINQKCHHTGLMIQCMLQRLLL